MQNVAVCALLQVDVDPSWHIKKKKNDLYFPRGLEYLNALASAQSSQS